VRGWQLLGLICEAFSPSDALLPHVYHYIYYNSKPDCPWHPYAKYCMYTLHNTVIEPPKPVTDFTLEHVVKFRVRICLLACSCVSDTSLGSLLWCGVVLAVGWFHRPVKWWLVKCACTFWTDQSSTFTSNRTTGMSLLSPLSRR
jgi:hypothetical protein